MAAKIPQKQISDKTIAIFYQNCKQIKYGRNYTPQEITGIIQRTIPVRSWENLRDHHIDPERVRLRMQERGLIRVTGEGKMQFAAQETS